MEKELLTGLLTKAYNKTSEEISELLYEKSDGSDEVTLKENAQNLVLDLDEKRVERLKSSAKPDKQYIADLRERMRSEGMEDFDKKLKAKYGSQSTQTGLDLVQEIIDTVSDCDISDEKVKLHPAYLDLESRKTQEIETLQQEHDDYKLNQDLMSRLGKVKEDVRVIFSQLNPIESDNPIVAQNRRTDFINKFDQYDYEMQENGNHLVLKDKNRMEDKHGNPVKFADFVKGIAELNYDFAKSDVKGQAGNIGGSKISGETIELPKTEKEYLALVNDLMLKKDDRRFALIQAWNESQK